MCLNSQLKQQLSERWRLRPFRRRPNYKRIRGQNVLYKGNELIENSCNRSAKISYGRSHLRTTECDRRVGSLNVHVWWCQELTPVSNETRNAEGRASESWSSNGSSARVTILPWLLAGTVISWMLRARITFSSSRCIWRRTTASWCSPGAFYHIAWLSLKRKMCFDLPIHTKYIITLTPEFFVKASFGFVQHQDYQYQLWRHFQLKLFCSFSWWHFQMNLRGQKSIKIRAHIAYLNETNLWCFWLNMETDPIFRLVADCF